MPNIVKYYYATKLMACLDWWWLPGSHDIILLEQRQNPHALADILVMHPSSETFFKDISCTASCLCKFWHRYQKALISLELPLKLLATHSQLCWLPVNI